MSELSPIKRALLEQRRLKARIEELERGHSEPIAVIGVGCRFPGGADGPTAFWKLLHDGVDAICEIPADRFDVSSYYDPDPEVPGKIATRFGGFLRDIDQFDPHLFGISSREAATMDPQQRLLLEVSWEALEHAGCAPDRMAGSTTGVFVGIGTNDYFQQFGQQRALGEIDAYLATGNAHSVASGRISYVLGLQGPSLSVDTACSSSLVAIHLGCESLRSGGCQTALAGGVGILLSLENYISLSKARMMAADGRCKTFDARADGFVRSEGCGMVVLKRLKDARQDEDRILAVIRGTACNQDGRSNGITAPNGPAQQAVIRAALANAAIAPAAVSYVEAHGTGTVLGDPIEVESLTTVLGEGRSSSQRLHLGSVKTNIGHLEAAAGVAGLIKTVLALQHRVIPPNLHFRDPNPHIHWDGHPYLSVPTTPLPWASDFGPRIAGVSAFGFSGTNVHMVLEEAQEPEHADPARDRPLHTLALSGKTSATLSRAAADLACHLDVAYQPLADVCYSVNTGRSGLPHRLVVVASSRDDMRRQLKRFAEGATASGTWSGIATEGDTPPVLFVFAGGRSQYLGLGRQLFETQPTFRRVIGECDALLRAQMRPAVGEVLLSPAATTASPNSLEPMPSVLFAIQYALAALWQSWGVTPAAVMGRGVGEYVAATVAGVLTLGDALKLVAVPADATTDPSAPPNVPVFSTRSGRRVSSGEIAAPDFWTGIDRPGAGRQSTLAAAASEGFTTVLDVGPADWNGLLETLAQLYVRGVPVDWRGFDRGYLRRRVEVPSSPYGRQRFWFDDGQPKPADTRSAWEDVTLVAARQANQIPVDVQLSQFDRLWRELNTLTTDVVAHALNEAGLFRKPGERHSVDSALLSAHILPMYRDVMSRWLERLGAAGLLERDGEEFLAHAALPAGRTERLESVLDQFPIFRDYLLRCERSLAAIATGKSNPLQVLFPDGSLETADFFYRHWGLARYFNGIAQEVAAAVGRAAPGRGLRVLEVGAGTGGTTASVLPALPAAGTEYWFTDLSPHFFAHAEESFAEFPFVRFAKFDLDESPSAQGIPTGYFDLVIAANAVHATRDVGRAVEHARALLAPGGILMLYEVTRDFEWFEMSWALVEGWQRHTDQLRRDTPLLSPERWAEVLRDHGFDRVASFPETGSPAEVLGHHVIVATLPEDAPVAAQAPAPGAVASQRRNVAAAVEQAAALREHLLAITPGEQEEELRRLVHAHVVRVMRLGPDAPVPGMQDRLMNIGVDSLMAVELKNALTRELGSEVKVPSTLIFDHPTIAAIATLLHGLLGLDSGPAAMAEDTAAAPRSADEEALADMTDAEAGALLLERLRALSA